MTNLAKAYTYGLALISQRAPGASTNFFGHDGHGSTRFLLNPAGSTTDTYMYDAFGNLIASNGTPASAYLYCGEQFDSDLGLYYLRARYFNPNTGRFWTMDTYAGDNQNPISMHKYLYCGDDPVNETDPEGQDFMATITTVMNIFTQLGMTPYASEIKAETWARSKIRVNQVGALIAAKARQNLASTKWLRSTAVDNFPAGANKCNKFVADNCNSIGVGDIVPMNFRITPRRRQPYPPAAGDWGNASTKIPGWTVVKDPEPGDIAAQSEFHTDASGHCCIVEKVLPGGRGITIGTSSFIDDQITRTDWGFRSEQSGKVVFKRYTGQ